MNEFDFKELEHIPVPEGLEQRLAQKIDLWAMEEAAAERRRRRVVVRRRFVWLGAACVAAVVCGVLVCNRPSEQPVAMEQVMAKVEPHRGSVADVRDKVAEEPDTKESVADAPEPKAQRRVRRMHRAVAVPMPEQEETLPLEGEAKEPELLAEVEIDDERQEEIDRLAERDTYVDPVEAYNEANRSLAELLANVKIAKDIADNLLANK